MNIQVETLVVGAGPAGIAAATAAASAGARVALADSGTAPGGQIWRGGGTGRLARHWQTALQNTPSVEHLPQTTIVAPLDVGRVLAEQAGQPLVLGFRRLILATGARERFLPFPGWTLPNVLGAGGLQALVKGGLPIQGKQVVVAGSGPLLLAVAAHLRHAGATVLLVAEQAPLTRLLPFGLLLGTQPAKAVQALQLAAGLGGTPLRFGTWVREAHGSDHLEAVTLQQGSRSWRVACDYLALGFGLVPNTELPAALGCTLHNGLVQTDPFQRTSVPGIYAAGEITGIGGVERSLLEGEIAGLHATGRESEAAALQPRHAHAQRFAALLEHTYALRPELRTLATAETTVCRCEDVRHGELSAHQSWRSAKLHTRCGMGPCQGRICGPAAAQLYGWQQDSIRPPVAVAQLATFAHTTTDPEATIKEPTP